MGRISRDGTILDLYFAPNYHPIIKNPLDLIGTSVFEIYPNEKELNIAKSAMNQVFQTGKPVLLHYQLRRGPISAQRRAVLMPSTKDEIIFYQQPVSPLPMLIKRLFST